MKVTFRDKRFPSTGGLTDCRYRMWVPEEPRLALQLTHGMAEHIDRYDDFAKFLAENGVLVYGMDLVGHGKSISQNAPQGYFGESNGWDVLVGDMHRLYDLIHTDYPSLPYVLMGHSMGSFLARTFAGREHADFDGYIFSGTAGANPALAVGKLIAKRQIRKSGGKLPSQLLFKLSFGAYNNAFKPNRTENDWLSRDNVQVDRYCQDSLCGFQFTSSAMLEVFNGIGEVTGKKWAQRVPKKPIFVLSGSMDPVGGNGKGVKQVIGWLQSTGHTVESKLYQDGRHEMLNEINRDEVYRDILLFLETVAAQGEYVK